MAKKTYSEKLKHPKWQRKRLEIMQRDDFKCKLCNDTETMLQVHHLSYDGEPWEVDNKELITLCEHCHAEIESLKKDHDFFDFNQVDIKKIDYENDSLLFFIRYAGDIIIRYKNQKTSHGFYVDTPLITELNKMKNKAIKYTRDNTTNDLDF
jgi:hypothetical protein